MRGHVVLINEHVKNGGITPAGAGTCFLLVGLDDFFQDHPRGCGDMASLLFFILLFPGSPPRVRGHGTGWCAGH